MKTAYYNGKIYTGTMPLQQAFSVENGRFAQVGSDGDVLGGLADGDERVDLKGAFVCPGFNDSHMHLLGFGSSLSMAQLSPHSGSLQELLSYVGAWLNDHPRGAGQWLLGRGWNQDYFSDVHRMPNRRDLDGISTRVPILLTRACGHCCVVNSRALELAGIGPETPAPEGGAIGMEAGEADGRLYDNAIELVREAIPAPTRQEVKEMLRAACTEANRYGITSVQTDDYESVPGVDWHMINDIYREMAAGGELTVRVYEQAQFPEVEGLRAFLAEGNRTGTGTEMFRIGPLKMLGDGSLGSRTAYLSVPYADAPDTRGFPLYSEEAFNALFSLAHENGMQLAVHAIGDACLDQVLDAMERALRAHPRKDHRSGVVHCQISRRDQLERIRTLGMHVYAQSVFLDYDNHIVTHRAGRELAQTSYSWKTLMDMGVSVSNGSDCPVELPDVMKGIECAVTRTSLDGTGPYLPEQAFSVKEALDSFTIRGAEASFEERIKGRIAPGYLADFTVLDENPFETEPRALHEIPVAGCFLGGRKL